MFNLVPGQVIGVRTGLATHIGIVTDRYAEGWPMVISNSLRAGGVAEESLSLFQGPYELVAVRQPAIIPAWHVLHRARQQIGTRWNLVTWNCEHFVSWAFGLEPVSPQLRQAAAVAGLFAFVAKVTKA